MAYPYSNVLNDLRRGIRRVESGGNYEALGPVVRRKTGEDRAYGAYQVMGNNIPSWTEMAIGRRLTPMEFLHSPIAQEAVFDDQMSRNLQKYGNPQDAASVWFSGRPLAQATREGAHDVNMPVQQYVNKALGPAPLPAGFQVAAADPDDEFFKSFDRRRQEQTISGGQPVVPPDLAPLFEKMDKLRKPPTVMSPPPLAPPMPQVNMPVQGNAPPPKVEEVWGPGMEYLNSASFGLVRSPYSAMSGYSPEQIDVARRAYGEQHPVASMAADVAGGVSQGLALALAGPEMAALAAGSRIARAIPGLSNALNTLAKTRLGYSGPYPSGGYMAQPGITGAALRTGAAAGGGAAQAAANYNVHPEIPFGEQVKTGAVLGGSITPAFRTLFGEHWPTLAPHMEEPMRDLGKMARGKYGINMQPWQLANMPEEEAVSAAMLSPQNAIEQAKQFGKAWGSIYGHVDDFTPKASSASVSRIGDKLETLARGTSIDLTSRGLARQFMRDLSDVENEIYATVVDPADKTRMLSVLRLMENEIMSPPLTGAKIQNMTQKNGTIDKNLPPATNSLYQYYNGKLKDLVFDTFHRADPAVKAEWDLARKQYKASLVGLKASTTAGIPDPKILATEAEKVSSKVSDPSEMLDLIQIGKNMFNVSEKGAPAIPVPQERKGLGAYVEKHPIFATGVGALVPSAISMIPQYGPAILSKVGMDPIAASIATGGLTAGAYAARRGWEAAKRAMLESPMMQEAILDNKFANTPNVLYGPVARGAANAAAESYVGGYRGRRRK